MSRLKTKYIMRISNSPSLRGLFTVFTSFLLLLVAATSYGAELNVQYTVIARSAVTPVPDSAGTFSGFGDKPAIDNEGNVVFNGGGGSQVGIYTYIGTCCQKIADFNTLVPNGGGAKFNNFSGGVSNAIDGGRVAFSAKFGGVAVNPDFEGVYSNVLQVNPQNLVEVAVADGQEWSDVGDPWIDGDVVALRGHRLVPQVHDTVLLWNGWNFSQSFVDPGAGYVMANSSEASASGGAVIYRRISAASNEIFISTGNAKETLAALNSTPVPGGNGATFKNFAGFPVIDRSGKDAAFVGYFGSKVGVYKRANNGALQKVTDSVEIVPGTGAIPGVGDHLFKTFDASGLSIGNGQVAFIGVGQNYLEGIYTDVGGSLRVVVDSQFNNRINLGGVAETITGVSMGPKSFAYTPQGYMVVFRARFASGGTAIIRATINDGSPPPNIDLFTVVKDFSDNSLASVSISLSCTSGTVSNNPQLASEASPAIFTIEGALPGAKCTAVESVTSGYTANQTNCQNRALNSSCTIINTLNAQMDDLIMMSGFD